MRRSWPPPTGSAAVPPRVQRLLRQIPPAALGLAGGAGAGASRAARLSLTQPRFAAGVLAGLVAWRTRNVALTLVVGLVALVVAEAARM